MQDLIQFIQDKTNKKIIFSKYKNQPLNKNQTLVTFDNNSYLIEMIDNFDIEQANGYFYLFYQQVLDFENLKRILYNLYEDIYIFEYNNYLIINSNYELDINYSTPEIIESETYTCTYISNLGKIDNIEIFKHRVSIFSQILTTFNENMKINKYITLNNLIIYKLITLLKKEKSILNLIDYQSIKNIDDNLLLTGISFIENDLNISKTSSILFLHRNTLIYRLEKIKEILNLDLKNFKDSLIFYLIIKSYLSYKK